jgi:Kef-type K+ transport system membrane component KefB
LGPAVFGLIEPGAAIQLLAEIGIFFLMFHAGIETQPMEFYDALKRSLGVAIVGAIVPFAVSFGLSLLFGLDMVAATFVGLTMTATAVVITLTSLKDVGLGDTRVARVIVASCVIDDMLTLIFFGLVIGMLSGGTFEASSIAITLVKVVCFFAVALLMGRVIYPRQEPSRQQDPREIRYRGQYRSTDRRTVGRRCAAIPPPRQTRHCAQA